MANENSHEIIMDTPINTTEPTVLLLEEACYHLLQNRLVRTMIRPWNAGFEAAGFIAGIIVAPHAILALVEGILGSFMLLVILYLAWYARFIHFVGADRPRCPRCTSLIWQFSCSRCGEPVPPLAFWLRGAFLSHCPHCGLRLSSRKKTLLSWCPICSGSFERPDLLLKKSTRTIVWMCTSLPGKIQGGWKEISNNDKDEIILYHSGDENSASLMYICSNLFTGEEVIPFRNGEYVVETTDLLLLSTDIPEERMNWIQNFFDLRRTVCQVVSPP